MHFYPVRDVRQRKPKMKRSFREESFPMLDAKMNKKVHSACQRSPRSPRNTHRPKDRGYRKDRGGKQLPTWRQVFPSGGEGWWWRG